MKTLFACVLALLVIGCSSDLGERPQELEPELAQYPHWFFDEKGGFNGVIIMDEGVEDADRETVRMLIEELQRFDSSIDESVIREYPTYANLQENNAILVGSCSQVPQNRWANIFLDCVSMLENQALIRIVDHHGSWLLFILGYDTERTRDAVLMLQEYESFPLEGQGVEVVREGDTFRVGLPR